MSIEVAPGTEPAWWRVATHPAVWSVPMMALLVVGTWGFNAEMYYSQFVNGDPQGPVQLAEENFTAHVFTNTAGVLYGQLLAAVVGMVLAGRHRHRVALLLATALSVVLAGVTALVSRPMVEPVGRVAAGGAFDRTAPDRVLLTELAGYPLYAACGVGLGVLVWRMPAVWRPPLLVTLALGWIVATATGLFQDDGFQAPPWRLGLPPIAAATAVALAALSGADPRLWDPDGPAGMVALGDWGRGAGTALLVGSLAWAVVLNAAAGLAGRPGARGTSVPLDQEVRPRRPWR